jgi:flagellar protein FliL
MSEAQAAAETKDAGESTADDTTQKKGSGKKKLLIIAVLVLALGGGGGYFMYAKKHAAKDQKAAVVPKGPPLFFELDPPFVVNFETDAVVRFLQITTQVMSRDPATIEMVKVNDPIIRNDLLMLLSDQKYSNLATAPGKEKLRSEALIAVQKIITAAGGSAKNVEAIYFTSFVMQ